MRTVATFLALAGVALAAPADRVARAESCSDAAYNTEEMCMDEAPSSLNCVWSQRTPGGDYEDKVCKVESCQTINSENIDPEGRCKSFGGCSWDSSTYYCLGPGEKVPCSMNYVDHASGEKCPSGCTYSDATEGCIDQNGKPACAAVYDETKCTGVSGCSWTASLYKCWETGQQIPCTEYEYMSKEDCPAYCEYIASGGSDAADAGKCMVPGSKVACEEFYNGPGDSTGDSECPETRCKWYAAPISRCWAVDKKLPCEILYEESCAPSDTCKWIADSGMEMGYCIDCPSDETGKCVQEPSGGGNDDPYNEPDDGKPCADHSDSGTIGSMCPEPRCYMEYSETPGAMTCNGESGTCRDAKCNDFQYEEDMCKTVKGCTYEPDSNMCIDPNGPYPCSDVYEQSSCPTASCDWIAPSCTGADCYGDGWCVAKGEDQPCSTYYSASDCPGSTCSWMNEIGCLSNAAADALPCSAYNSEDSCPAPKCDKIDGVCWETGKALPCSAVCTPYECVATGRCMYSTTTGGDMAMGGQCLECEGGACPTTKTCSTFTSPENCPESHCTWSFEEDADNYDAGICEPHVCVSIYEAAECKGHAECTYSADTQSCWPTAFKKPCKEFWDQSPCESAQCTWDSEKYICFEKGAKIPCADLYEEADCGKDSTCTWADYECRVNQGLEPSTPPPLPGKGDGTGNEDESKCTSELFSKVSPKLAQAESECIVYRQRRDTDAGRDRRTTKDQQLECLAYFLEASPNSMTVADACPCLWAWATEIDPFEDHWMKIAC